MTVLHGTHSIIGSVFYNRIEPIFFGIAMWIGGKAVFSYDIDIESSKKESANVGFFANK